MKPVTQLWSCKKIPDCNILVGTQVPMIRFAEHKLGKKAYLVEEVTDDMLHPGTFYAVPSESKVKVVSDKLLDKSGVWDCSLSLDPDSACIMDIIQEAGRLVGIKVEREAAKSLQWKLFEGTGGVTDVQKAVNEMTQWIQLPLDPKPELPWFNSDGWFRLAQVLREAEGYIAFIDGDTTKMTQMGVKETRLAKWNLPIDLVKSSVETLNNWQEGHISEDAARLILRSIWQHRNQSKKPYRRDDKPKK